jgi:subtilisin family serine protease
MRERLRIACWTALALAGCAPKPTPVPQPNIDPGRVPTPPVVVPPAAPPTPKPPVLPPSEAYRRGLMPLASTNVWAFRQQHPTYDGRGVLIGILDSGIDAGIAGLGATPSGDKKLLDLRDFSAEGKVALAPLDVRGDSATIGGQALGGMKRVVALAGAGAVFGGVLAELPLGKAPAADVNGNGTNTDRLPVVVAKASDGWVLFADQNGNGTIDDDRPVHDYLVAKETFGWSTGGRPSPLTVAVNFSGTAAPPGLDLFFDNSGHGTHVAGIAAGDGLYGVADFDGSAPGASIIGLKIANNALGGISVTGSMIRAMDYGIKFARERNLPLVFNMSFGVGNETEGAARIDAMIDSVLAANPDVTFVTSAGNDGPGLSTMGFPASAARVITVGATFPPAFLERPVANGVIAYFSSRGGELSKPDVLAPGIAYSSVPRWDTGSEDKSGTSMASPHVAGAIAALLSGIKQERRTVTAAQLKQGIVATARTLPGGLPADEGAGLLDLVAADRVLKKLPAMAVMRAHVGSAATGGIFRWLEPAARDTTVTLLVEGTLGGPIQLSSDAGWLAVPPTAQLTPPTTKIPITVKAAALSQPGVYGATVKGWASDTTIGPLFRVGATVVRPHPLSDSGLVVQATLAPGEQSRVFFAADSGRPFRVRMATAGAKEQLLAFLHEPGGQPYRVENGQPGGFGQAAATYEVDGRDVVPGAYEAIAVASPGSGATAEIRIDRSPVTMSTARVGKDTVVAAVTGAVQGSATGTAMFGIIGAERTIAFSQSDAAPRRIAFRVPPWAKRVVVEVKLRRSSWPLFTDFGLAVYDPDGQLLAVDPLNYSLGRSAADLPAATTEREYTVALVPAFADPAASTLWDADVSIRLYAEAPVLVEPTGKAEFTVGAGQRAMVKFPLPKPPWPLPDAFFPLGNFVVDSHGTLWGLETRLSDPKPPIMR